MTTSLKPKILIDLLPALDGFAGIPQESRLLFKVLAEQENAEIGGLIYSNNIRTLPFKFSHKMQLQNKILTANYFDSLLKKSYSSRATTLHKIKDFYILLKAIPYLFFRKTFSINEIDGLHFFDFIWRKLFAKTLKVENFDLLAKQKFFVSDLNIYSIQKNAMFKKKVKLATESWDFVIFQFQRAVQVSPNTKKIIRYHDSIAFKDMDVTTSGTTAVHTNNLLGCSDDSFYVCNSEPTREELCKLVPELKERSATIPPIIANYTKNDDHSLLANVIKRGISSQLLSNQEQDAILRSLPAEFSYIMILSTIEPRKNHINLIRAWEKLRLDNKDLKLIIVGNVGWDYEEILSYMKPHVRSGDILHLEKIPPADMGVLYSHAHVFVFPSYNEGFGSPPLEAMQCECPVVASDIKTHRWVYGNAAVYCNPYDVDSIKNSITSVLTDSTLKLNLIQQGKEQVKLYSAEIIGKQWMDLFARL